MTNYLYIVNVQGAIYHDGKYLVARRSEGESYMAGEVGFPGGKVESVDHTADDVTIATLKRELLEEVNVYISDPQLIITRFFEADGDKVINMVYLCRYVSGEPQAVDPDEVSEVMWMTVDEILNNPNTFDWTHLYINEADDLRQRLGW